MALRGTYDHSVDAKGRVSLPAKFRKALPDELVVLPVLNEDLGKALYVFSDEAYDEWIKAFFQKEDGSGFNPRSMKDNKLMAYLDAAAEPVTVDAAGRIKLSAKQCGKVGIAKDVQSVGRGDHIEIWDAQAHEEYLESVDPFAALLEE